MGKLIEFTYTNMHVQYPYVDALVVTIGIANHNVHCVFIDNGSFLNILIQAAYNQMGLPNDQLRPSPALLHGFLRQSVIPEGNIKISLIIGT